MNIGITVCTVAWFRFDVVTGAAGASGAATSAGARPLAGSITCVATLPPFTPWSPAF